MNRPIKSILTAAILTGGTTICNATIHFENVGVRAGWTTIWEEDGQGSVTEVSSPNFQGGNALKCETVFRTTYGGRYHTEVRKGGMCSQGMDRYYGFTFYLPSNWQFVDQSFNIQQFIGNVNGCTGGQPVTMTHLQDHSLVTRITTGPDGCTRTNTNITATTSVTSGAWHRVVLRGKWQSDNTGIFQFWYDGSQKINKTNQPTIPNDDTVFNLALGNYSNGWHDDKMMVGTQSIRDIYIDHVRVASSFSEADPSAWTEGQSSGGSYVKILNRNSGKALNVDAASTADGAQIIQWPYSSTAPTNDEWQVVPTDSGYVKIVNRNSGKVLNVDGGSTLDGANIIQWTYSADTNYNDEWQIVDIGSGYSKILNRKSGKALNVDAASTADGAKVIQWPYSSTAPTNDEWQITSVP